MTQACWGSSGRARRRGVATVEFALVSPLLMTFLFGTIELGAAFKDLLVVQSAARVGARTASLGATEEAIATTIAESVPTLDINELMVETECLPTGATEWRPIYIDPQTLQNDAPEGSNIRVRVRYRHRLITGGLLSCLSNDPDGAHVRVSGLTTMQRE